MKLRFHARLVLPLAAVCLLTEAVHAAPKSVATVQLLSSSPTVRRKGAATFVPLAVRSPLYPGDIVHTGTNSKLNLLFSDGSQVRLNANSTIEITAPVGVGRGRTSLFRAVAGEMWSRLRPGQAVQTPHAVAGVRGTEFDIQIADDQTTTLSVVEGEVEFYNQFGTVFVDPAQQSVARAGQAPTQPVTVNNPGLIVEWTAGIDRAVLSREKFYVSLDPKVLKVEEAKRAGKVQQNPADSQAELDYADILFDQHNYEAALSHYQKALEKGANAAVVSNRTGNALLELGRLDEAQAQFEFPVSDRAPLREGGAMRSENLIGQAWIQLLRNNPVAAEALARQASGTNQSPVFESSFVLGVTLLRQPGKEAEARQLLTTTAKNPLGYQANAWLALLDLEQGNSAGALREARAATAAQPYSALAHGNLALVSLFGGETQTAAREAKLAASLDPNSVAARVVSAQVLLVQGKVDEAAHIAAQAVALDPRSPQALYLLGLVDAQRLDYTHAARSLRAALQIAPDDVPVVSLLARVLTKMGRPAEGVTLLTDLQIRLPQSAAVLGALGETYYQQGKYALSAASYSGAAKLEPGSALFQAGLSRTLLDDNQLSASIAAGQQAVRLAPGVGQYHSILGLAYEYSGLSAQAERQFREALVREPQNALALVQLAYKHEGADLRPGAAGFAQGFLLDPAVSDQLVRGGVNLELTPTLGTDGQRSLDLTSRVSGVDGKLHSFAFVSGSRAQLDRSNTTSRVEDGAEHLTYVPGPRTNAYFTVRGRRTFDGLGGSTLAPSGDDSGTFKYGQSEVAVRQRLGDGRTLWAGMFGNASRSDIRNPDLDSFFDNNSGLPISNQRFKSHSWQPEVRLDLRLDRAAKRPGLLTLGAAHAPTSFDSLRDLQFPIPDALARAHYGQDNRSDLLYAQLDKSFGDRFSFVGQVRYQHLETANSARISLPGSPDATLRTDATRSRILPSLLATYQLQPHTSLRFSYNQRVTDVTTSTFAPVDTLLTTEAGMLPTGTPDRLNLTQLTLEHSFSSGDFLKLFVFRSTANTTQIGGTDLLGFGNGLPAADAPILNLAGWRSKGVGARYERRLTSNLFATAGVVLRDAQSALAPGSGRVRSPYDASLLANLGLNYIDPSGNKVGLRLRRSGSFYQDSPLIPGRERFGGRTYVDLHLAREASLKQEFFFDVTNLFDSREIAFNGYPLEGRRFEVGVTRRF